MNERIQELWSQAGGHYNSGDQHTWPEYTITDPKKFAELIVRECANVAKHHVMNISTYADADFVEKQIQEHFGVEE